MKVCTVFRRIKTIWVAKGVQCQLFEKVIDVNGKLMYLSRSSSQGSYSSSLQVSSIIGLALKADRSQNYRLNLKLIFYRHTLHPGGSHEPKK